MSDLVRGLLSERRRRAVADTLGSLERSEIWDKMSKDEQERVRQTVRRAVNGYHELVIDLLKVMNDGTSMVNDQAVAMIADVHRDMMARRG